MSEAINYLPRGVNEEGILWGLFQNLQISEEQQKILRAYIEPLKLKGDVGRFHYEHSIRVAYVGVRIAQSMGLDPKVLLYAGLMHDIGKALVSTQVLGKTEDWTKEDAEAVKTHVADGYKLLRDQFDFTAQVMVWHHKFQENCYPTEVPAPLHEQKAATNVVIQFYGRLLMIADTFDALHRVNYYKGEKKLRTGQEIQDMMLKFNPDLKHLIEKLYKDSVLVKHDAK